MVGHGSPKTSRGNHRSAARCAVVAYRIALIAWLTFAFGAATADELRLRIAWGGGDERLWRGTIAIRNGSITEAQPLGLEADEPGSMWLQNGDNGTKILTIRQRSPRGYDGVDVAVESADNGVLLIQLSGADDTRRQTPIEVSLADLADEFINKELDGHGNRLLVMRAPGDTLRVRLTGDRLVFAPGETLRFSLKPQLPPIEGGGRARIRVQLLSDDRELWTEQHEFQVEWPKELPLQIVLPKDEGLYDVVISAVASPKLAQAVRQPLNWKRTIDQRRIQLLVLAGQRPDNTRDQASFTPVVEIDPANPRWFEKLNKLPQLQLTRGRLPRLVKEPLGNGCRQTVRHALGELAQLSPNAESPDISWEAYWLPLVQAGRPHVLEVEYPSDVSQSLGLCIVEPDAAGGLTSLLLDSGFDRGPELSGEEAPRWLRHRLIFWPRTTTPLLLVSNGRDHVPAVYGKIRVLMGGQHLPRPTSDRVVANRRLWAAYLDRPLFAENFAGVKCLDAWSGRSLDDWGTFYDSASRLVEYLNHAGYNALMLSVVADGSTIYPSEVIEPTPRYDTGVFFATGQDPVRKDVLEMLFRLFNREDLRLIPAVEFAAPLPELEALLREGGSQTEGIELLGAEGTSYRDCFPPQRGLAPYYNVLDPRVQRAMLGVLRELIERYGQHPSFAGLAVRLSADGYAQLPGPDWGLDDATIARFQRDTKLNVPGAGPQRFAQRKDFLGREPHRRVWLEWRAKELAAFYRRVAEELTALRPDSRLYLVGAGMTDGPELERELRPALPRRSTMADILLRLGIDVRLYADESQRIVIPRPERMLTEAKLAARAADLEIGQMADFDRCFQTAGTGGSLFFHQPRELRIASFDGQSPFKPSRAWIISQPSPAGEQNRRRFVQTLAAMDAQVLFDGGWLLPMGQEEATQALLAAYRSLPSTTFQTITDPSMTEATQPVTFRCGTHGGQTYLYAVNTAPFAVTARVNATAKSDCRLEEMSGRRKVEPLRSDGGGAYWEVRLEAYDMVAVRISDPNIQFSRPRATWPTVVENALGAQIRKLGARAAVLRTPPPLDVPANLDFESPADEQKIPDWGVNIPGSARLDRTEKHSGEQSVRLTSTGSIACLASRPFAAPGTGRLSMAVWLRVADAQRQPPLRLALEGKFRGRDYYRFAPIGFLPGPEQSTVPLSTEWSQYIFQVDDLPLEGLTSLRVRFDLMGAGEVWIDDVRVYGLAFNKAELVELSKLITLADVKLQHGRIGDCLRLLDGYWPRFLEENVPLPAGATIIDTAAKPQSALQPPSPRTGWLDRMYRWGQSAFSQ